MTGITGVTVGNHDGRLWGRRDFQAGQGTGQTEGYRTLSDALEAAAEIEGAEVISARDGKYYLNEIRGTRYSQGSQSEVSIRAHELVRGLDGQDYAIVGFVDDYNHFIAQYDHDENLEMMGQAAEVQGLLELLGEDLSFKDRMTILGAASGIDAPQLMSNMEKITAALQRMPQYLPEQLQEKFAELVQPENLAVVAGVLAIWAGSHAVGVGQAVDAALLVGGLAFLGLEALDVAQNLYDFAQIAVHAQTEADLDRAAQSLADGLSTVMVGGATAGLGGARVATRAIDDLPRLAPRSAESPSATVEGPVTRSHAEEMPELQNRAEYQRYLDELTAHGMPRPREVRDARLNELIGRMYRDNAEIGRGSTADAVRFERQTGVSVGGSEHQLKAQESITNLTRWLRQAEPLRDRGEISAADYRVAERLIADLQNALQTPPLSKNEAIQSLRQYLNDHPDGNADTRAAVIQRLRDLMLSDAP